MRKPKIGDIVLFHAGYVGNPDPAVVRFIFSDGGKVSLCVLGQAIYNITDIPYSEKYEKNTWSWPEEEKQCEHDIRRAHSAAYEGVRLKCIKCGYDMDKKEEKPKTLRNDDDEFDYSFFESEINRLTRRIARLELQKKEEKPKECEHTFTGAQYTHKEAELICKKCGFSKPWSGHPFLPYRIGQQSKAEELIEKIWEISAKARLYSEERPVFDRLFRIYNLIKEYKGIKC